MQTLRACHPVCHIVGPYLDEGFILDKKISVNQPKRLEKAKVLLASTPMNTDKVRIFGAHVNVKLTSKLAEQRRSRSRKADEAMLPNGCEAGQRRLNKT